MRWSLVARNNFGPQVYWGDCFTHGSCYILRADERGGGQSMGLYFNTVETARMVFRLNKHFGPTAGGGNIDAWRSRKHKFKKGGAKRQRLGATANDHGVDPDSNDDPNGVHKQNWRDWLDLLEDAGIAPSQSLDPVPIPPASCGPKTGPFNSTVGVEIGDLIFQGLNTASCEEIVFVVLPATTIAVDQPQTFGSATAYSLIITVRTKSVTALKAAIRRVARMRRIRRAANKKKS